MKTLGILGGMGPEATHFFYKKIVEGTPAKCDQEHIPTLIFSNTITPDRGTKIRAKDFDEIHRVLQSSSQTLEAAGADILMMPCNTAHYFIGIIRESVSIPVLNMIEETALYIHTQNFSKKIGILGTNATIESKMYHSALSKYNIETITPDPEDQDTIMNAILHVKAGNTSKEITETLLPIKERMRKKGVQQFVLGCTEIPLLFQSKGYEDLLDPMDVLAQKAIAFALNN